MTDWTDEENEVLLAGGALGGEYLDSIAKTDLAQLTGEEWLTFLQAIGTKLHEVTMQKSEVWLHDRDGVQVAVYRPITSAWAGLPEPKFSLAEIMKFVPDEVISAKQHLMPNTTVRAVRELPPNGDEIPF